MLDRALVAARRPRGWPGTRLTGRTTSSGPGANVAGQTGIRRGHAVSAVGRWLTNAPRATRRVERSQQPWIDWRPGGFTGVVHPLAALAAPSSEFGTRLETQKQICTRPSGSPTILAGPDVPAGNIVYTARSAIPTAWLSGSARCVLYRGLTFTGMGIRNRPTTRDSTSGRWPPRSIWCIQTRK